MSIYFLLIFKNLMFKNSEFDIFGNSLIFQVMGFNLGKYKMQGK